MAMELTVGKRIILGFTLAILVTAVLGVTGVWAMFGAKANSQKLADEYVPEVKVATALRGATNRLMYQMRGYGLSEKDEYFQEAQKELANTSQHIDEGFALADNSQYLKKLRGQVEAAQAAYGDYAKLISETQVVITEMQALREKLDKNASTYMENCNEFLAGQNASFKKDLAERQHKISIAKAIADLGTSVRVSNFKAQVQHDPELLEDTIAKLGGLEQYVAEILPITRQQRNLDEIANIKAGAEKYATAMGKLLDEMKSGAAADGPAHDAIVTEMDEAAHRYVTNCNSFMESQQQALTRDMTERHDKITFVNSIIDLGNDARIKAFKAQATRSPEVMEDALKNFDLLDDEYAKLRQITRRPEDLERIENTKAAGDNYSTALSNYLQSWKKLASLAPLREQAGERLIAACKTTADAGMEQTESISQESAASLARNASVMVGVLIAGVIVSLLSAFIIIRSVTGPLNRIIDTLQSGSANVAVAAGQVSESSQSLASGASEQAASIEETNSSVEEMASMIKNSANNAVEASDLSSTATKTAISGADAMSRMSEAIDDIKAGSDETAKIVKTIDEIAFQTNLLALNAAVEAARAGEAGKGFAVVAEEVRNLAQRSAEAARNTANIIEGSIRNADNGVAISKEVASFLNEISEGSRKVNDLISDIATANKEQASGIDQISRAVSQMDQVTQANAADAEESAAASEELSAQAEQVDQVVSELQHLIAGSDAASRVDRSRLQQKNSGQIMANIERRKTGVRSKAASSVSAASSSMNVQLPAPSSDDDDMGLSGAAMDESEMIKF